MRRLLKMGLENHIFIALCSSIYLLESGHAFDCGLFEVSYVFLICSSAIFFKLVISEIQFFRPLLDEIEAQDFTGVWPRFVILVHAYLV